MKSKVVKKKTKKKNIEKRKDVSSSNRESDKKELFGNLIKLWKKYKWIDYLIIVVVSLFYFILILDSDIFYSAHDLIFHVSNIKSIAGDISLSNLYPDKILSELVNNLGYGVNLFYPVFPHMVGAYLYKLLGSIPATFKVLDFLIINISGIIMYKYLIKILKERKCALMGAISYISMPYMFADVFIRCALNECFLFFIVPLIFLGIHYLLDDNNRFKFYLLFVLGYVMAINTHLVLSVYLTIIVILYMLLVWKEKVIDFKIIKDFMIASLFIILLVLNFIVPLLEHYSLGVYDIFNVRYVGLNGVETTSLFKYLFPIRHLDITLFVSLLVSISLIYLVVKRKKIKTSDKPVIIGVIGMILFSLVLATSDIIWMIVPNLLRSIQFGWRMSLFISFGCAVLFGYVVKIMDKKLLKFFMINFIVVFAISNFLNTFMIKRLDVDKEEYLEEFFDQPRWEKEYLTIHSTKNFLNIKQGNYRVAVSDGSAKIKKIKNKVPDLEFEVVDLEDEVVLKLPRIYYLGYELVDDKGNDYEIVMDGGGLMRATIDRNGKYKLRYVGTKLDRVANLINYITIFVFMGYMIILGKRRIRYGDK